MTTYTIVDASGEIVSSPDVPDAAHLQAHLRAGCTAIPGRPTRWNVYRLREQWIIKPPSPGHEYSWDAKSKAWIDARTLEEARADARWRIRRARDAAMLADFSWRGHVFQGDAISQAKLSRAAVAAVAALACGVAFSESWTLADNTQLSLDATDMVGVLNAMHAAGRAAHHAGVALLASIATADAAGLAAITWPTTS